MTEMAVPAGDHCWHCAGVHWCFHGLGVCRHLGQTDSCHFQSWDRELCLVVAAFCFIVPCLRIRSLSHHQVSRGQSQQTTASESSQASLVPGVCVQLLTLSLLWRTKRASLHSFHADPCIWSCMHAHIAEPPPTPPPTPPTTPQHMGGKYVYREP